jgi:hypothetical protein
MIMTFVTYKNYQTRNNPKAVTVADKDGETKTV